MKPTTKSGLAITAAPFWVVWIGPADGERFCERFPHLRVTRPQSGNGKPLSETEALSLWLRLKRGEDITATGDAEDYLDSLREIPSLVAAACRCDWPL